MRFKEASDYILKKLEDELPASLCYHSIDHTVGVYEAAQQIAAQENISAYDIELLLTAACFHDTGFLKRRDGHELISCQIARDSLPDYGYNENEITRICGMIMATRIPQSPKNHLEEILADADLDYLGRDDFFIWSNKLHSEITAPGDAGGMENWTQLQIDFLEQHRYFTKTSLELRTPKKLKHIAALKSKLKN